MERVSDVEFAATLAREGHAVVWVTTRMDDAMRVMKELAQVEGVSRPVYANGAERVEFVSGGRVLFASLRSLGHLRGYSAHVVMAPDYVLHEDWFKREVQPCVVTSQAPEPFYSTLDHDRLNV